MATMTSAATMNGTSNHVRRPSTSAPMTEIKGPVGPEGISRPKHKRTATGFGPSEIKHVESSIPEGQRAACVYLVEVTKSIALYNVGRGHCYCLFWRNICGLSMQV